MTMASSNIPILVDDGFNEYESALKCQKFTTSKKSKSTSSSLARSSNVSDKNLVDSSLDEHNVNSVDFGGDFEGSDDYKWYLNESSTRSEKSHLDIYLEEPELELNSQIDVLDYWSKSLVRYNELSLLALITPLRSSLKPKTVQAVVCLDDWMRAKGFSTEIGCKNDDDDEDDEDDVSSIAFSVTFISNC
ncbi:hypothetical protein Gotur_009834 [Gossypium turneri]